jgi:uncharacterized protein YwgA/O-acetyl-ADP-ribose deacetylase (regulator of RNase III)
MVTRVLEGNVFESGAQTLVNTVNCVGVMGKGVALEFKKRFPEMFHDYAERCSRHEVQLGRPYLYRRLTPPWILNFPTKDHWRSVARLQDIVRGLEYLEQHYREWGITSLAVPPLGCGLGQLEWRVVGRTLYRSLAQLPIKVELYAPFGTPQEQLQPAYLGGDQPAADVAGLESRVEPSWVALVEILKRIENERYHWPVGRTTFQKIAYFATAVGIPTKLVYRRGSYGPYAPDLKRVVTQLVNNSLIGEERLGQMLEVKVGPTYDDAERDYHADLSKWRGSVERLADLFLRMDTQKAEIAATVHFAASSLAKNLHRRPSEKDVLDEVMLWKQRRRPPLTQDKVAQTIRNLSMLGWLDVEASVDLPLDEEGFLGA